MILEVVGTIGPATFEELADESGLSKATLIRLLGELERGGKVVRDGKGTRGNPHRFSLPDDEGDSDDKQLELG